MRHFFRDVIGLGDVAISRHAERRREESGITEEEFVAALRFGAISQHGETDIFLEFADVRLVVKPRPQPYNGHALVLTTYRLRKSRGKLCESLAGAIKRNCQGLLDGSTDQE